ncbi:Hypothetical predicted protein [Paramuricea clavata]|uniref:Uncharacterized protein n=1 Tax=Paramuricea clavata TaxID=317549 RepID=A0A7D9EFC9_PARCT|nr:Hypothetical predicted protein [Paramuricea clavata]
MVDSSHLMYQEVDAFLTEQLRQPYPVTNWQKWPTLYSFCQSLATIASRRGYNFYVGEKRYGMKEQKDQIAPVHRYCHPGPSLSTLDERKAKPVFTSGVHLENVALLLQILKTLNGVPSYQNNSVLKFIGIMHYDGMPLNIGTFPRAEDKTVIFDGITPPVTLNQMVELQKDGTDSLKKYISEHCEWISEVNEYDITDASGAFYINAYTEYATVKGTANDVKEAISNVVHSIEVCQQCIKESRHGDCTFTSYKEACNRCKTLQTHGLDVKCTSFKVIHVSSDQASVQRKAHSELSQVSAKAIDDVDYIQYGFGMLHFCKNAISSARNYRLTNMSDTFTVSMLTAIWASKSEESKKMKETVPAAVFSYKDRHSDELCFQTVSESIQDIVNSTKHVLVTLVPEQYRTYAVEAKTRTLLGRPLYITTNSNGDFLWTDAEFEVVVMGNRHNPTKCISLGKWDEPGSANENQVPTSKASFSHPAGLDVMVCREKKREICFVSDQGNHVIRFINGIKTINGPKCVGTLKIHHVPEKWRPEGLTVIDSTTLAITAGTELSLIRLDESLLHGQLITIVNTLQSPRGLCFHPMQSNSILVADGNVIKEINISSKETSVVAQGFQGAFGISAAANGEIGITDVGLHRVSLLKWNEDAWINSTVIGSGDAGCRDGNATTAELHEPTGITFDMNSALICCIGGRDHGCIKLYSQLSFATEFMSNIRNIYDAIGFIPKKEHNKKRKSKSTPILPFTEGIEKLASSLSFMQSIMLKRKAHLGKSCLDGSDGSIYTQTLEGLAVSVASLQCHSQAFNELNTDIASINLYAFTNESRKEHNFAKHKQSGQYRHPTMQQYCRAKGCEEEEIIKKFCECPHSYHTNAYKAYQATHRSSLLSTSVIEEYKDIKEKLKPIQTPLNEEDAALLKEDLKKARVMNMITRALPTQNVRDVYRAKCGYAPCIVDQLDASLFDETDADKRYYPSFQQLMDELHESINSNSELDQRNVGNNDFVLLAGDIAAVNPGTENGIPSGDKWWLLQVNKAVPSSKTSSGCHVSGFWLEQLPSSEQPDQGCALRLQRGVAKTYYGSLIKTNDKPAVISVEQLNAGWQDGAVVYKLTQEFIHNLDKLSDEFRDKLFGQHESEDNSDSDSDDEETSVTQKLSHEVQEEVLQMSRRRIIRSRAGQNISSYAELSGQRQKRGSRTQRTHMLGQNTDEIVSALRD